MCGLIIQQTVRGKRGNPQKKVEECFCMETAQRITKRREAEHNVVVPRRG